MVQARAVAHCMICRSALASSTGLGLSREDSERPQSRLHRSRTLLVYTRGHFFAANACCR
eukprot:3460542-Prymnesium_polylepis.1